MRLRTFATARCVGERISASLASQGDTLERGAAEVAVEGEDAGRMEFFAPAKAFGVENDFRQPRIIDVIFEADVLRKTGVQLEQDRRLVIFPVVAGGVSPRVGSPVFAQGAAEKRPGKYGGRNQSKAGRIPIDSQVDPLLFEFIKSSSRYIRYVELKPPQAFAKTVEQFTNRQRAPASEGREQASKAAPELLAAHRGGRVRKQDCQPQGGYSRSLQPGITSTAGIEQFSVEPAPADRPVDEQPHGLDDLNVAFPGLAAIRNEGAVLLIP